MIGWRSGSLSIFWASTLEWKEDVALWTLLPLSLSLLVGDSETRLIDCIYVDLSVKVKMFSVILSSLKILEFDLAEIWTGD